MYSKCGTPEEAHLSFNEVTKKDLVLWTSMISVYAKLGCSMECLRMFFEIQVAGISPDGMVISCVLTGIANSMRVYEGKAFHGLIFRRNFEVDQMVHNALLSMYLKFGLLALSEKLFCSTNGRDKESWNIMVVGNSKVGLDASCIKLFREMQMIGVKCDSNSLVSVISSCSRLGATHLGRSLHCYVIKKLFHENISVTNSIIDMYGKSGNLTIAQRIFCMTQKDAVTWNALINSYAYNRQSAEALALFDKMVAEGVKPKALVLDVLVSSAWGPLTTRFLRENWELDLTAGFLQHLYSVQVVKIFSGTQNGVLWSPSSIGVFADRLTGECLDQLSGSHRFAQLRVKVGLQGALVAEVT
ncbi:hypothetical protein RJ639_038724 [Escallonia herrerae]|uniref:Pentatricopeptide repeat-containing protein n=1 Tax=Escallonia herrerae TaxID=1293975 RepID=A0AA88WPF6_9ASTE|nr:hypothetical protein RJ639_038724 [Escallonia herrerae]